jgi:hypothetical protein
MAVMIIVILMFSLTRAKINSEILLIIRTSKVTVTGIIHQCEEMLLPGKLRSAQVKGKRCISIFSMVICFMKHRVLLQKLNMKNPGHHVRSGAFPSAETAKAAITRKRGWVDLIIILNSMTTLKTV